MSASISSVSMHLKFAVVVYFDSSMEINTWMFKSWVSCWWRNHHKRRCLIMWVWLETREDKDTTERVAQYRLDICWRQWQQRERRRDYIGRVRGHQREKLNWCRLGLGQRSLPKTIENAHRRRLCKLLERGTKLYNFKVVEHGYRKKKIKTL